MNTWTIWLTIGVVVSVFCLLLLKGGNKYADNE